jgi:Polyketide cyclase / dehydrase and lipid transport
MSAPTQGTVTASARIHAPAARLYGILADYRLHHPRIVPTEYVRRLEVEVGGVGEGTRTLLEIHFLGTTRRVSHIIREPEPGRVLEEVDADGSSTTTFVVEPTDDGESATVTIRTTFAVRSGLLGAIERVLVAAVLRRMYAKELALLDDYATPPSQRPAAPTASPTATLPGLR